MIRRWRPARQDPALERLVLAQRSQEHAWRTHILDCSTVDEEVRQAQAEVDRIRNGIWHRHWASLYAIAGHHG